MVRNIVCFLMGVVAFSACSRNTVSELIEDSGTEKIVRISLCRQEPEIIMSRTADEQPEIKFAAVIFQDSNGNSLPVNDAPFLFLEGKDYVETVIPEGTSRVLAICNYEITTVAELAWNKLLELQNEVFDAYFQEILNLGGVSSVVNSAYKTWSGAKDVMSGVIDLDGNEVKKALVVPVKRVVSLNDFHIKFQPVVSGESFLLSNILLGSVPEYSNLFETPDNEDETMMNLNDMERKQNSVITDVAFEGSMEKGEYFLSVYLPENREGGIEDKDEYWPWIAHYPEPEKLFYKQMYKRKIAIDYKGSIDERLYEPTYLQINGIYTRVLNNGDKVKISLSYYIYLGADNYKDFNVKRNKHYIYNITIRKFDEIDSRIKVTGTRG